MAITLSRQALEEMNRILNDGRLDEVPASLAPENSMQNIENSDNAPRLHSYSSGFVLQSNGIQTYWAPPPTLPPLVTVTGDPTIPPRTTAPTTTASIGPNSPFPPADIDTTFIRASTIRAATNPVTSTYGLPFVTSRLDKDSEDWTDKDIYGNNEWTSTKRLEKEYYKKDFERKYFTQPVSPLDTNFFTNHHYKTVKLHFAAGNGPQTVVEMRSPKEYILPTGNGVLTDLKVVNLEVKVTQDANYYGERTRARIVLEGEFLALTTPTVEISNPADTEKTAPKTQAPVWPRAQPTPQQSLF